MAASPRRRTRRLVTAGAVVVLAAASVAAVSLRNEPADADYLRAEDASRAVTRATILGRSDQVVGVSLARAEATVRVQRGDSIHTWAIRPGREAVETGVTRAGAYAPVAARKLDLPRLVAKVHADPVAAACKPATLKAEVATSHYPVAQTHVWCLDGARHAWLGPHGDPLPDVDPRTPEGLRSGLADLRMLTGARRVSYVAVRFGGEDAGVDIETPGTCGDLAACDAVVASRRLHVESRDPALQTREAPARLNYADLIDVSIVDPTRLHAAIERQMQTRQGIDWWRNLTVTLYQRPGHQPTLEFKQGSTVFWTDMDGTPAQF